MYNIPNGAAAITTSDTAELQLVGLYVGGTGDVKVDDALGNTVTFKAVPVGTTITCRITRVYATLTTATNLVGFKL